MIRAYLQGLRDGWAQPWDLSMGMTYGDDRDAAYDHGANLGQRIGRIVR